MSSARIVFDPREWAGSPGLHEAAHSKIAIVRNCARFDLIIPLLRQIIDTDGQRSVAIFAAIVGSGDG
jgi:hypothetical protein